MCGMAGACLDDEDFFAVTVQAGTASRPPRIQAGHPSASISRRTPLGSATGEGFRSHHQSSPVRPSAQYALPKTFPGAGVQPPAARLTGPTVAASPVTTRS